MNRTNSISAWPRVGSDHGALPRLQTADQRSSQRRNRHRTVALKEAPILTDSCPTSHCKSTIEHYPSGSVVACVFLTANPSVYSPVHESIAHCWRDKEMIQPHPLV